MREISFDSDVCIRFATYRSCQDGCQHDNAPSADAAVILLRNTLDLLDFSLRCVITTLTFSTDGGIFWIHVDNLR
jgi:hypothetical protein